MPTFIETSDPFCSFNDCGGGPRLAHRSDWLIALIRRSLGHHQFAFGSEANIRTKLENKDELLNQYSSNSYKVRVCEN